MPRYTDEQIAEACAQNDSVMDVMRHLGMRLTGGSHSHVTRRIRSANIDTSHFTGKLWSKGRVLGPKLPPETKLVLRESGARLKTNVLVQGLLNLDRKYICEFCLNSGSYNGKPLVLEVDHINENWLDDRPENLRFLCPNCHSQR